MEIERKDVENILAAVNLIKGVNNKKTSYMAVKDAESIVMAVSVLKDFNEKYGCPHGENPFRIVLEALKCLQISGGKNVQ